MILRRNNKLAHLPPEDRARLDAWLQKEPYRQVLKLAAAPRPEGLGLQTNLRALSCYFNKFLAPNPCDELADLALHNPQAAEAAATSFLQVQAINGAAAGLLDEFNPRKFNALARFQQQLQQKAYRERLLDYQKQLVALRAGRHELHNLKT